MEAILWVDAQDGNLHKRLNYSGMQLQEAITFLQPALAPGNQPVSWCDLGCGAGLFTHALGSLLPAGSRIVAVDKQSNFTKQESSSNVAIRFSRADFVQDNLPFPALDGILMANSLHYVKDKPAFVEKGRRWLTPLGMWIIIEYETTRSNPWVPYPLSFESLTSLFQSAGYQVVTKVAERKALYNSGRMYCAVVKASS